MFRGRYIRVNQLDCVKTSFHTTKIHPRGKFIQLCCRYNTTSTETLEASLQTRNFNNAWTSFNQLLNLGQSNQIEANQYSRLFRLLVSNSKGVANDKVKGQKILDCMRTNRLRFTSCEEYAPLILFQAKNDRLDLIKLILAEMKAQGIEPDLFIYNQWIKGSLTRSLTSGLEVLKYMEACGVKPDFSTFNILLKSPKVRKDSRILSKIGDKMLAMQVKKGVREYNILIESHLQFLEAKKVEEIFQEMKQANVSPNSMTFNLMIRLYGKLRNPEKVLSLYDLMKENDFPLSSFSYGYVAVSLAELSKIDEALQMLEEVDLLGFQLAEGAYEALIREFLYHSRSVEAIKLYQKALGSKISLSVKTFTQLMHQHLREGNPKEAMRIYEDFIEQGSIPDSKVFTVLIEGQNEFDSSDQMQVLWREINKYGVQMDDYLSNTILHECIRNSWTDLAIEVFDKTLCLGSKIECNIYRGLLRLYQKDDRSDAIKTILRSLSTPRTASSKKASQLVSPLNIVTSTVLIRFFTERFDLDGVRAVHTLLQRDGVQLDNFAYNTLLNGYSKCGDFEAAKKTFTQYLEEGTRFRPDTVAFNIMMRGYTIRDMYTQAIDLLEVMDNLGISPNTLTFNTLIDGCIKCGDLARAENLAQRMEKLGIRKSTVTFNEFIFGYMSESNIDAAKDTFKKMIQLGIRPNIVTFSSLIHGYVNHARFTEANECLDEMRKRGISPTIETYNNLMSGYVKAYRIDDALKVYDQLSSLPQGQEITPTAVTYSILMNCWGFAKQHQNVLAVWKKLKAQPNFTQMDLAGSISVLLDSCGSNADFKELQDRWLEVNSLNISLSENNHISYWEALVRCDRPEKAVEGLEAWCRNNGTVSRKTSEVMLKLIRGRRLLKRIRRCLKNNS
ncbi:hypothetical protein K7432_003671 [Basidiobolus ranarum]|uniref:Pentatricopeptide repeat-containing protein n=1 Tax=Basidiobolus ranarum TaxID=34480 RepID=A0ABR2W610_9FUNG